VGWEEGKVAGKARNELATKGHSRRRLPSGQALADRKGTKERGFFPFVFLVFLLWQKRFGASAAFTKAANGIGPRR
jgi:hypothetical protein